MFQLDDKFLADVGLAGLPDDQKKPFLQLTYDRLEYQVGIRLSEGMSDTQLEEFESIIDRKMDIIDPWLANNAPNYQQDQVFTKLLQASGLPATDQGLKAEFAATKWLEVNRPDYRDVVAKTLAEIKEEIIKNKEAILGNAPAAAAAEAPAPSDSTTDEPQAPVA